MSTFCKLFFDKYCFWLTPPYPGHGNSHWHALKSGILHQNRQNRVRYHVPEPDIMYLNQKKILTISLKQESQILYICNHRVWYHVWVTIKSKVMTCYKKVNYHVPVIRKSDIIEPEIIDTDYITCFHSQF